MENLIFDRTQNDLEQKTPKGYYNYTDLNRIEIWCEYLSNLLNSYSYPVSISIKKNWNMSDLPNTTDMERIRSNVNAIKTAFHAYTGVPENLNYMTIEKANAIEKILSEIDKILGYMENTFIYCRVANCNQERVWQQRFRKTKTWASQPYKLSQYALTDTINMIATNCNRSVKTTTKILGIATIDKRDDLYVGLQAINKSMQILDGLVGG
jgi:hypothetical protein